MREHSVKAIRKKFHDAGVFYTPPELIDTIKKYADIYKPEPLNVYDPTCGSGDLLSVYNCPKYGQEIDAEQLEQAKERFSDFVGVAGDTLKCPAFIDKRFDLIVANYPFSIKWEPFKDERFCAPVLPPQSKADYAFILHILYMLADDGVAVVMGFPGILYRQQREGTIRQWLIEQNYIDRVVSIPGNKFTDTTIATCILIIRKDKGTTDITFEDTEHDITKTVDVEEVRKNNYNLSVSSYVEYKEPKETIDPYALEVAARKALLKRIRQSIETSRLIETISPGDIPTVDNFINDLQKLIDEYKERR